MGHVSTTTRDHIYELIKNHLKGVDSSSKPKRWVIYENLRFSLIQHYGMDQSRKEYQEISEEFDHCVSRIEREFEAPSSLPMMARLLNLVDKLTVWHGLFEKASKIASILSMLFVIFGCIYWFFISRETRIPELQKHAIQQTACKFLDENRCDRLIEAIERTKNASIIAAANAGDLKPAEQAMAEAASRVAADPKATANEKARAEADLALVTAALGRMETQLTIANAGIRRVEILAAEAKKEVSSDPLKELANIGVSPTDKNRAWILATQTANIRMMDLLVKSKLFPDGEALSEIFREGYYKKDFHEYFMNFRAKTADIICRPESLPKQWDKSYPGLFDSLKIFRTIGRDEWRFFCEERAPIFVSYFEQQTKMVDSWAKGHEIAVANFMNCRQAYNKVEKKWKEWQGLPFKEWSRKVDSLSRDELEFFHAMGRSVYVDKWTTYDAFMRIFKIEQSPDRDAKTFCYVKFESGFKYPDVITKSRATLQEQKVVVDALR